CCAVSTARSRAAATTNLARASLALVLRVISGAPNSCALVNLLMICPQWSAGGLADHDEILPLITAISWRTPTHGYEPPREAAMAAFARSWRREKGRLPLAKEKPRSEVTRMRGFLRNTPAPRESAGPQGKGPLPAEMSAF